jgi:hypothetical protein
MCFELFIVHCPKGSVIWPMSYWKGIVTHLTISRSAICAADILEAWTEHDDKQLSQKLARDTTADFEPFASSHENERLELLDGITTQIRGSIASGHVQDANVYIPLLRHLAKTAGTGTPLGRNYVC